MIYVLGHWFLFLYFRSEKIQNLMREGGKKKHLGKRNNGQISGKVNESDEIKNVWTYFK